MAHNITLYAERVLMANNICDRCLVQNHIKKIKSQSIQLATTCSLAYIHKRRYVYRGNACIQKKNILLVIAARFNDLLVNDPLARLLALVIVGCNTSYTL